MKAPPPGLKIKLQVYCGQDIAMGPGKADLLEAIDRCGSIAAAGRALGMSYRRAWLLVDAMNRCWSEPLVATVSGGATTSGSALTPLGRDVLAGYRALQATAAAGTASAWGQLAKHLLPSPRARMSVTSGDAERDFRPRDKPDQRQRN